jgi:hypothetical protein
MLMIVLLTVVQPWSEAAMSDPGTVVGTLNPKGEKTAMATRMNGVGGGSEYA